MKSLANLIITLAVSGLFAHAPAWAGQVEIVHVRLTQDDASWTAHVTLNHADAGWDHYADGWRVLDEQGNVLGHRTLYHPHAAQPFTRSLSGIKIPKNVSKVVVEAHDSVHDWSPRKLEIDLSKDKGEGYEVRR